MNNNFTFYEKEAVLTLPYSDIESIVAYLLNFDKEDLPETLREEILPKMQDFLLIIYN